MTSFRKGVGLGLIIVGAAAVAQIGASASVRSAPARPRVTALKPSPHTVRSRAAAPTGLRDQIAALGRNFDGKAGIAVVSLGDGWEANWNANVRFPQQSCSKLWVAITALDAVDRGRISLDDRVSLDRSDLTLFHQPLAAKILA